MTTMVPLALLRVGAPAVPEKDIPEVVAAFNDGGLHKAVCQIYHIGYALKQRYKDAMKAPEGSAKRRTADPHDALLGDRLMKWAQDYRLGHPYNIT